MNQAFRWVIHLVAPTKRGKDACKEAQLNGKENKEKDFEREGRLKLVSGDNLFHKNDVDGNLRADSGKDDAAPKLAGAANYQIGNQIVLSHKALQQHPAANGYPHLNILI